MWLLEKQSICCNSVKIYYEAKQDLTKANDWERQQQYTKEFASAHHHDTCKNLPFFIVIPKPLGLQMTGL